MKIQKSVFNNETEQLEWFDCANSLEEFVEKLNDDELSQHESYFRVKGE